ncbi:hypothetical protein [Microbacterium hydrocarbonoxydans]|uniref:hypothetical protein n=1 Tax=Microbacterium hydrocarbonoxydans TaxID=273678 RepID=UPI0008294FDE|nr:hypothetical protein [Microbacterium hydrocarbonoxydans]
MTAPAAGAPLGYFDARALTDPVDDAAVDAFTRARRPAASSASALQIVGWVIALGAMLLLVVPILSITVLGLGYMLGGVGGLFAAGVLALLLVGGVVVGAVLLIRSSLRAQRVAHYRLAQFAASNALTYIDSIEAPPLPGMLFGHGSGRRSTHVLRGEKPRFVEFGNYQYTTGSGDDRRTHHWGYVAVKLDVPLPHIVLDALGNNALGSAMALGFQGDQRLSLEGDFDRYFSLYCPAGYETDALYLFTPDVMARFIDHAAELDVEIVDDWLFLYTRRAASSLDPATWAWLFGAVAALLSKLDQWARWRDDRLRGVTPAPIAGAPPALPFAAPTALLTPPPGVAPPGQRLKRRSPWLIVGIIVAVLGAVALFPVALGMLALLLTR